jgi:guanosine-3',5'-bis(diphosphate) 3'-pyrophosphohydrolase
MDNHGAAQTTISVSNLKQVVSAINFAAKQHKDQRRKDADRTPYVNHPITLVNILANEADITHSEVLTAAALHDTIEDTDTTPAQLISIFGETVAEIVMEVTDDKSLPKSERKLRQIKEGGQKSHAARLVKLADKIANLRDMANTPPADWSIERRREYFDWSKSVVDQLRGTNRTLESLFDQAYARRP